MVYLIDDSIGALIFLNECNVGGNVIIDNMYWPLAMMPKTIKYRIDNIEKNTSGKLICTNPSMSIFFEDAITGIESFKKDFEAKEGVVLSNKIFAEKFNGVDVQVLANTVVDGNVSEYVAKNLLDSYIGDAKVVYIMEPCIHYYREFMGKFYPNVEFRFLFDYLKAEIIGLEFTKSKFYVTGNRIGLYMGAEELLGGNYSSFRRLKW